MNSWCCLLHLELDCNKIPTWMFHRLIIDPKIIYLKYMYFYWQKHKFIHLTTSFSLSNFHATFQEEASKHHSFSNSFFYEMIKIFAFCTHFSCASVKEN